MATPNIKLITPTRNKARKWSVPRLTDWYLGRSQWHEIRNLGSTSIVRLSVVAPVVGYLILANRQSFQLFEGWKLFCFYFGTGSIAVGAFIYSLRCPGEAKKYDTAVDYALAEAEFFTANPFIIEKAIKASLLELQLQRPDLYRDVLTIFAKIAISHDHPEREVRKDATMVLMDELWHIRIFGRRRSRVVCRIFYDIGTFLIFLPSVFTVLQILHVVPRP